VNRVSRAAASAAGVILLAFAALAEVWVEPPPLLDDDELRALVLDTTWRGEGRRDRFVIHSARDGTRRMLRTPDRGGAESDVGRWWIEDGQLCSAWRRHLGGLRYCLTIALYPEGYRAWYPDGQLHAVFTVEPGNRDGL
jgi:hypothetical protein